MKSLYYFSKKQLKYIEIRNFRLKLTVTLVSIFVFASLLFFTGNMLFNSSHDIQSLQSENQVLRKKVVSILSLYKELNITLDSLTSENNNLRVAVNLKPISKDEMLLGVGGGYFDNSVDFLNDKHSINLDKTLKLVDAVSRKISFEKEEYKEIKNRLAVNRRLAECIPAIKPLPGEITSGFGMRMHPILHYMRMHDGIDILANVGSPVRATGDGIVQFVGHDGGYGLMVRINHGFGYKTAYAHLSKILVKRGQKVKRGQVIAKSGDTGLSTGPHLHYEVEHNGVKLNPDRFFFDNFNYFDSLASR